MMDLIKPLRPLASDDTRQRLLDAAGGVFAEQGFRNATIQEICRRAGANIAAVNYHFGDKERLYAAVIEYADRCASEESAAEQGAGRAVSPEDELRGYVRSFLLRLFAEGRPAWLGKLITREMVEPTGMLDTIVREKFRPHHEHLAAIVRRLLGRGASEETVRWCTLSIRGQMVFYHNCRPAIARLFPDLRLDHGAIERLAAHISEFSLAALRELAGTPQKRSKGRS
jgi:AcrR family transcriptional regulator